MFSPKPFVLLALLLLLSACTSPLTNNFSHINHINKDTKLEPNNAMQDFVTKQGGTEEPFKNEYWDNHEPGIYIDANTGTPLFSSLDKYDSGTGWPAFTKTIDGAPVDEAKDLSHGVVRTEVKTNASHLGHVFSDGPDGGNRYCINSAALKFVPYKDLKAQGLEEYKELFPYKQAAFAAGCFWGVESLFEEQDGVIDAVSGYMGGKIKNPNYAVVSLGVSGHAETVLVTYDPGVISYEELLDIFWRMHNPTQKNRQGPDVGSQYRSVIFAFSEEQKQSAEQSKLAFDAKGIFDKPAVTEIVLATDLPFYPAEEYHQNYADTHPSYVCHELRDE